MMANYEIVTRYDLEKDRNIYEVWSSREYEAYCNGQTHFGPISSYQSRHLAELAVTRYNRCYKRGDDK